jgi:hypothetical protein
LLQQDSEPWHTVVLFGKSDNQIRRPNQRSGALAKPKNSWTRTIQEKIAADLQYEGENSGIKPSPSVGLLKLGAA